MKHSQNSWQKRIFDIDYSELQNIGLQKQDTLRWLVGVLGIFLPLILVLLLWIHNDTTTPLDSISHYFYTRAGPILVIIVSLLAVFLLIYKGDDPLDFWLSTVAGIAALTLLYFPTDNISDIANQGCNKCAITRLGAPESTAHFIAAGIFFACLAFMAIFLFTKNPKEPKIFRLPKLKDLKVKDVNNVYVVCGVIIVIAIVAIPTNCFLLVRIEEEYHERNITFWAEVIALEAFGWAWFVKGHAIQKVKNRWKELVS